MACFEPLPPLTSRSRIKTVLDMRLSRRQEALLRDQIPPIPTVKRTRGELARSPDYKQVKTQIPVRLNRILIDKHRECNRPVESGHDFGFYTRPANRRQSTTIQDLTTQLRCTRERLVEIVTVKPRVLLPPVRRVIEERQVADFVSAEDSDDREEVRDQDTFFEDNK
eukprot:sb/3472407/